MPPPAASDAKSCHFNGTACTVSVALLARSAPDDALAAEWVAKFRPCHRCRVKSEAACAKLRSVRLGRRERSVFLLAVAAEAGAATDVTRPGLSRSDSMTLRRAAQKLARASLLSLMPGGGTSRTAVVLTALGAYVDTAFGRYIRAGKPIRWTRPLAGATPPGEPPEALIGPALDLARAELQLTLKALAGLLSSALNEPVADPMVLERDSRDLTDKSAALRRILAA